MSASAAAKATEPTCTVPSSTAIAAERVEHDIDRGDRVLEALARVVNDLVGAERAHQGLVATGGRPGDERALPLGELHGEMADAAGRGMHEHPLAFPQAGLVEQPLPGGEARERHSRGVHVVDFGSGGLDLAYEVMRGYDALILIDVSRQGGTPGTLYVMEADPEDVDGQVEDGQMLDPHGMDPETVLRFVKYVGGWPGRVFVVACEPEVVEDVGFGLSEVVSGSVARAADVVLETVAEVVSEPDGSARREIPT